MKKLFFLFTLSLLLVSVAWGQGSENFSNLPTGSSTSYENRSWTGTDGVTWTATSARTDQTINSKAICWGNSGTRNVKSPTYSGGMGTLTFNYVRAFTGTKARSLEVYVNNVKIGSTITVSPTSDVVMNYSETVNVSGDVVLEIRSTGGAQVKVDDITWTGYASSTPTISVNPTTLSGFTYILGSGPSAEQSFVVSGINLTDDVTISLPTNYEISDVTGANFLAATAPIVLTQVGGEVNQSIYVRLKADLAVGIYSEDISLTSTDAADQTLSLSGLVEVPAYTALPYGETFDADLGDIYTHSVLGDTKVWDWDTYSGNGFAKMSGYDYSNEAVAEEDWLILPGIDMSVYANAAVSFDTAWSYGTDDADNYLKFMYSSNYTGVGNPNDATWVEIPFTQPSSGNYSWQSSGTIVLDDLPDETVFFAFKYGGTASNYRTWEIDNIFIDENLSPILSVTPSALEGFSYDHNHGPSAEQSFVVSGANLTDNISINAPANYEISVSSESGYIPAIVLNHTDGTVDETTIYTRLKAGLAIDTYNEDISVTSTNAETQFVNCDGEVSAPPAPDAPEAIDATGTDSDSFTANWETVSGATGYYLDVYTKTIGATSTDLFISEYIEGSSYNKAIEIYNGTGTTVDLSNYSLLKQSNGAGAFVDKLSLIGNLTDGDVYVVAHSDANATILTLADQTFDDSPMNFNGNDCVALYKNDGTNDVQIDVVGVVDQVADWGKDVTLVRKSSVSSPTTTYSTSDWDSYEKDTTTYLGSHTMAGGSSSSYVTGFDNRDVSNVTSYEVTGLDPETEYYYVVRAYDAYAQTSTNSNEIELTTLAASTYDIPDGEATTVGGATVTISGGSANIVPDGVIPAYPNSSITVADQFVLQLIGAGPWTITIQTDQAWGSYYTGGMWHAVESVDGIITFTVTASKDLILPVVLANDTTLPVELSSFTAEMNSDNHAVISWVTQTETGVSGYYVLRNSVEDLETALQISALIEAANTSQEHTYSFIDEYIYEPGTYYYWLHVVDIDGTEDYSDPISVVYEYQEPEVPVIPQITEFKNVYPNPFNPNTNISYALSDQQDVTFSIYNSRGQLVRQYDVGSKAAGNYSLVWDGTDYNGRTVTTGVYFIRMQAGRDSFFKKAVLMK